MTYQRDPEQRRPRDFIRREDGSFSGFALIVGIVAVVLLGFLLFRPGSPDRQVTSSRTEAPSKTQPAPTTPAPAPTPSK